ncbi:7849_t:CDS:2, partial [Funneliformis geosporum]
MVSPTQQEIDDLKQKFLDYKKDKIEEQIESMIKNYERELSVSLERDLRHFFGDRYHSLLTKYLTLDKLNDDNYFNQIENTIKLALYGLASQEANRKQYPG